MAERDSTTRARSRRRRRLICAYYAIILSAFLIWGLLVLYTGIDHNASGEFCTPVEQGEPANWSSQGRPCNLVWSEVWLTWLVVLIVAAPFLLLPVSYWLWVWMRRRRG